MKVKTKEPEIVSGFYQFLQQIQTVCYNFK